MDETSFQNKNNYSFIQKLSNIPSMKEVRQVQLSKLQMEALKILLDQEHTAV